LFLCFIFIFKFALHYPLCRPRIAANGTGRRLGAGGASTNVPAGDKRSIPHKIFCGRTAPLAPNRLLSAGILPRVLSVPLLCRLVLHCRYGTQSHYYVGLHSIAGTVLNSTTLSACTPLSVWYSNPLLCRLVLHCRYGIQFHYFVGLYSIVGTVLNSTTLSACTPLSVQYSISLLCRLVLHCCSNRQVKRWHLVHYSCRFTLYFVLNSQFMAT